MFIIRPEKPADQTAVYQITTAAFGRPDEAILINRLRDADAIILSLVATYLNLVVGHALVTSVRLQLDTGAVETAVALGPIAVHPNWQRQRISTQLIEHAHQQVSAAAHTLIFVLGHADYYPRFGYQPTAPLGIRCQWDVPADAFMVRALTPEAVDGKQGTVYYHPEFDTV